MVHFAVSMEPGQQVPCFLPLSSFKGIEFKYPTQSLLNFFFCWKLLPTSLYFTWLFLAHNQSCMLWCSRLQTPDSMLCPNWLMCIVWVTVSWLQKRLSSTQLSWVHKFNTHWVLFFPQDSSSNSACTASLSSQREAIDMFKLFKHPFYKGFFRSFFLCVHFVGLLACLPAHG